MDHVKKISIFVPMNLRGSSYKDLSSEGVRSVFASPHFAKNVLILSNVTI